MLGEKKGQVSRAEQGGIVWEDLGEADKGLVTWSLVNQKEGVISNSE